MQTNTLQTELTLLERFIAPNSKAFGIIQKAGILLGILGGAILSAEAKGIKLPGLVSLFGVSASTIAGLIASASGLTAFLVAQFTVDFEAYKKKHELDNI